MKNLTILVPASIATMLISAVVFASTPTSETQTSPAIAPNRADLFVVDTCGAPAAVETVQATNWHSALGSKRILDRAVVLAKDGAAQPCEPTSN